MRGHWIEPHVKLCSFIKINEARELERLDRLSSEFIWFVCRKQTSQWPELACRLCRYDDITDTLYTSSQRSRCLRHYLLCCQPPGCSVLGGNVSNTVDLYLYAYCHIFKFIGIDPLIVTVVITVKPRHCLCACTQHHNCISVCF